MSKRSPSRDRRLASGQRVTFDNATPVLTALQDYRLWSPTHGTLDYPQARTLYSAPARLQVPPPRRARLNRSTAFLSHSLPVQIGFKAPRSVLVCIRRKQRRQVLHALGRTGLGARAPRRLSRYSSISCR